MITQVPFSFIYPANTEKVLSMCCNSLNKYLCVWPSKLEIRRKMKDFFCLFTVLYVHHLAGTDFFSFLKVGLQNAYVIWGFCCAVSLKISTWAALEGLQGIYLKRHFEYHKTFLFRSAAFAFWVWGLPLGWRVTHGLVLPCLAPSFPPLEPPQCQCQVPSVFEELWSQVGHPLLSEAEVMALGSATSGGGITGNCIIFLGGSSMCFRISNSSAFAFSSFFPLFFGGGYSFRFLIMYSAHTPGCQLNFIGPFKGQINLCFYKEKIKDQLSWPLMNICYWSLQSSYASLEETLPFAPSCLISWCIVAVT